MTTLGHTLVGASIAMICTPVAHSTRRLFVVMVIMVMVASLPDWPIPVWGHHCLEISHSIIVNAALLLFLMVVAFGFAGGILRKNLPLVFGIIIAWMSHFLMDTLYSDSSLTMFWPISKAGVSLPIPWLKTMPHIPPPFDQKILNIFLFETVTFLPLLLMAAALRNKKAKGTRAIN